MQKSRIAAVILIIAGILGLIYGSVTFTKETHRTNIGPIELALKEKETVNIPLWAGIGSIVLGGGIFFFRKRD